MAVKCGEILCQSTTDFSILCTFCNLKIFEFDDFVLHFKNIHFGTNGLLKSEDAPYSLGNDVDIKGNNAVFHDDENDCTRDDNSDDFDDDDEVTRIQLMKCIDYKVDDTDIDAQDTRPEHFSDTNENELDTFDSDVISGASKTKITRKKPKLTKVKPKSSAVEGTTTTNENGEKQIKYKCSECPNEYKSFTAMRVHVKREHETTKTSDELLLQCSECDSKFNSTRNMENHQIRHHNGIKCTECGKNYKCKRLLQSHMYKHSGERNFICDFPDCGKSFFDPRALNGHKRNTHSTFKKFICDICGYTCRVQETLRVHYRSHTGEKPYGCKLCDRHFASSSLLREHMAMHSSDRPHVCDVCGANFARQKALYHHRFLHLRVKKFKCKICGNAYAQLSGLAGHMRKHKEGFE